MRTSTTAVLTFVWVALTLPFAAPAIAADLDGLKAQCNSCHGPNGNSPYSDVPTIAGQSSKFIAKQLRAFQLWDRPCAKAEYRSGERAGTSADKCQLAGALAPEEISAVADDAMDEWLFFNGLDADALDEESFDDEFDDLDLE